MNKQAKIYSKVSLSFFIIFVLGLFGFTAAFGYGSSPGVIGGGGGGGAMTPPALTSFNVPMTVGSNQQGTATQTFADNSQVKVEVPAGSVGSNTTFSVTQGSLSTANTPVSTTGAVMINGVVYNINATNLSGDPVRDFSKDLTISITVPNLPANTADLGVYYYNDLAGQWQLIPGATFNPTTGAVTFSVDHLTKFAVVKVTGTPTTLAVATPAPTPEPIIVPIPEPTPATGLYPNGTLLRNSDMRIYIIENGLKRHITTLTELRTYAGKPIVFVAAEELTKYPTKYSDGTLIRGTDYKIYVIKLGQKVPVKTLDELRRYYAGKPIINVSLETIALY